MKLKYVLIIGILAFSYSSFAQSNEQVEEDHEHHEGHDHGHNHNHHGHEHHRNEIGIANAPVYFVKEKELTYGLHFHYIHNIKNSNFGIGLGYERIFDEHKHNTIGIVGSYRVNKLVFNISPGITFERGEEKSHKHEEEHEEKEYNFALHLETTYEFAIGDFHIGPVLEFAYDPEDYHVSLGLHVGYGF